MITLIISLMTGAWVNSMQWKYCNSTSSSMLDYHAAVRKMSACFPGFPQKRRRNKGALFESLKWALKEVPVRNRRSSIHAGRGAEIEPTRLGFYNNLTQLKMAGNSLTVETGIKVIFLWSEIELTKRPSLCWKQIKQYTFDENGK